MLSFACQPLSERSHAVPSARAHGRHDARLANPTGQLDAARFNPATRSTDYRFSVPLATLAPGEYLLAFELTLGKTTATRAVRFVVK